MNLQPAQSLHFLISKNKNSVPTTVFLNPTQSTYHCGFETKITHTLSMLANGFLSRNTHNPVIWT